MAKISLFILCNRTYHYLDCAVICDTIQRWVRYHINLESALRAYIVRNSGVPLALIIVLLWANSAYNRLAQLRLYHNVSE